MEREPRHETHNLTRRNTNALAFFLLHWHTCHDGYLTHRGQHDLGWESSLFISSQ
jgi:hypothetical protein